MRRELRFLLNDEEVALDDAGAGDSLLDFLRLRRGLRGTKEGCAEGDCGACTVMVGRLRDGDARYEVVNSCIRLLPSLDGCHVVTVEHLSGPNGGLHPVQQAMVDCHGSQCGFCTPGIVMALYALWLERPRPTDAEVRKALQGNLCRCTGYAPILRAAAAAADYGLPEDDGLVRNREAVSACLAVLADGCRVELGGGSVVVPADEDDLAEVLASGPAATVVAGATDVGVWINKDMRDIVPAVFIGHLDGLCRIEVNDEAIEIGAAASYSDVEAVLTAAVPGLADYWSRIGGWQIRNMGTVGGNIANGSPIADLPPVLIALGAELILRRGAKRRAIPLEDYFIDSWPARTLNSRRVRGSGAGAEDRPADAHGSVSTRCPSAATRTSRRCARASWSASARAGLRMRGSPSAAWQRRRSEPGRAKPRCAAGIGTNRRSKPPGRRWTATSRRFPTGAHRRNTGPSSPGTC